MNKRTCKHEECPYRYCIYHKYWNGKEQDKLDMFQKLKVPDLELGESSETCLSFLDI